MEKLDEVKTEVIDKKITKKPGKIDDKFNFKCNLNLKYPLFLN